MYKRILLNKCLPISIRIKKETDDILHFLTLLTHKKPSFNLDSKYTYEFNKITKLLNKVAIKLSKREKQKAKRIYGVLESQFRKYYEN